MTYTRAKPDVRNKYSFYLDGVDVLFRKKIIHNKILINIERSVFTSLALRH